MVIMRIALTLGFLMVWNTYAQISFHSKEYIKANRIAAINWTFENIDSETGESYSLNYFRREKFDTHGQMVESLIFSLKDSSLRSKTIWKYDQSDSLIQKTEYKRLDDSLFRYRHRTCTYFVDSGLRVSYILDSAWLDDGRPYYQYDERHVYLDQDNRPIKDSLIHHFVTSNRETQLTRFIHWYKYDDKGLMIEDKSLYISEGNPIREPDTTIYQHQYDNKNRLILITRTKDDYEQKTKEFAYGENEWKKIGYHNGEIDYINQYEDSMLVKRLERVQLFEGGDYRDQFTNYSYEKQEDGLGLISVINEESYGGIVRKRLVYEFYE